MKTRDLGIDMIKTCAMFSVISLHCSVSFHELDNHIVADIMRTWGLTGVPLFFMVSGYLTLGKDVSYAYAFRKISLIIRFVACFSFLYWLTYAIKHSDFDIIPLLKGCVLSFVNRGYFPWFWFLGSMSIIYILLPILNCFFPISQQMNPTPSETINPDGYSCRYADIRKQWSRCGDEIQSWMRRCCLLVGGGNVLIIILLSIQFVVFQYAVNEHMSHMGLNISFKLYNWLAFFIIGGILKKYNLEYKNWILPVLLFVTNFFFQSYEKNYLPQIEFYYSSFLLLLLVISIFLFIKSLNCTRLQTIIRHLSKLFLLVYSTHLLIMRYVPSNLFGEGAFSPLMYFFTISILAVAFSFCITKIPFLNKILSL